MRIATLLLFLLAASSPDPMAGNWQADLKASTLPAGFPDLRSQTMVLRFFSGKIQCITERVDVKGVKTRAAFSASVDGKRYPVTGMPDIVAVSMQKSAGYLEADFFFPTSPAFSYRLQLSGDGNTLTIISIDPIKRTPLHARIVYHRQASSAKPGGEAPARALPSMVGF
ncbi:MAG TPA: hypothetical protein VH724_16895 [Candidatus Angelobacter sp.]|nr:hypothetical protein [Candidatus Angelobacter sp.]